MYVKSVASPADRFKMAIAASVCAFTTISSAVAMLAIQGVVA
ncbi:MAG TPA: hypothetical protein VK839_03925 [Erythrobacter sp.]|nr:hypothetical protein [Erythrobacter sp.]